MLSQKLCKKCKTGRITYENDPNSPVCPYLSTYSDNKCTFYVSEKQGFVEKVKNIVKPFAKNR